MDLYDAFGLADGSIVAAVGGGGKTSLIYALAQEAAGRGLAALVLTTTRFSRPPHLEMPRMAETSDGDAPAALSAARQPGQIVVAISGHGEHGRMLGFQPETIGALAGAGYGLIAIEADGSRQRPFKAPAGHEPVIPPAATDVIVCLGLDVLGRPLDERFVHRAERVAAVAGAQLGEPVTADIVTRVLLAEDGGRKNVPPGARLHALLNAPTSDEHERLGIHIAQLAVFGGYARGVVANARVPGGVRAVVR